MTRQTESGFFFLFRSDLGRIDRATWWKGVAIIVGPLALMTLGWRALSALPQHGMAQSAVIDPAALLVDAYHIVYGLAIILAAICFYNLSAKRFRDRGRPRSLAGVPPFAILLAGAAHWFQPRSQGEEAAFVPFLFDALVVLVALWSVAELGFRASAKDVSR